MTAVDVDALAKLREAATEHGSRFPWRQDSGWGENILDTSGETIGGVDYPSDAALIVAAVNALEPLLAEVRRGRALREAVLSLAARADVLGEADFAESLRALLAAVDGGEQR